MYVSTEIDSFKKYGDNREIIRLLKDSGFTAYDFSIFVYGHGEKLMLSDDYREQAQEFRTFADSIGIVCNQTHAPYPSAIKGDEAYNEKLRGRIIRAIEISGILGAKVCVVHPCNDYTAEENEKLYRFFEPYARKAGVKIGLENMWNSYHWGEPDFHALPAACSDHADFLRHLERLPSDVFVACVDIGHAELKALGTSASEMIETLGSRVQAIHLHDVDGVNDNHTIPFTSGIDFEPIIESLRKIGYNGDVTLECAYVAKRYPVELHASLARHLADIANYFKKRLEQ
ncbi:MAG: sugar phosphate isomerase/epimerase [Clostridia bacterium]|nr:sugar phosphate isomerase/epimerase [Clostridia bacterium]